MPALTRKQMNNRNAARFIMLGFASA